MKFQNMCSIYNLESNVKKSLEQSYSLLAINSEYAEQYAYEVTDQLRSLIYDLQEYKINITVGFSELSECTNMQIHAKAFAEMLLDAVSGNDAFSDESYFSYLHGIFLSSAICGLYEKFSSDISIEEEGLEPEEVEFVNLIEYASSLITKDSDIGTKLVFKALVTRYREEADKLDASFVIQNSNLLDSHDSDALITNELTTGVADNAMIDFDI